MKTRKEAKEEKVERIQIDIDKDKFNPDNPKHLKFIDQQIEIFEKKLEKVQFNDQGIAGTMSMSLILFCFTANPILTYLLAGLSAGAAGFFSMKRMTMDSPEYKEQLRFIKQIFQWSVKTPESTGKEWALKLAKAIARFQPITPKHYADNPLYTSWQEGDLQKSLERASPEFKETLDKNSLYTVRFFTPNKEEGPVYPERDNASFVKAVLNAVLYGDYEYKDFKLQNLVPYDEVLPARAHWW